jgi:hypothetical protein
MVDRRSLMFETLTVESDCRSWTCSTTCSSGPVRATDVQSDDHESAAGRAGCDSGMTRSAPQRHRDHAIIEQVIAELKDGPLAHLPSGQYAANAAWLAHAVIAFNLARAAAVATPGHARPPGHPAPPDHQRPRPDRVLRTPAHPPPAPRLALGHRLANTVRPRHRTSGPSHLASPPEQSPTEEPPRKAGQTGRPPLPLNPQNSEKHTDGRHEISVGGSEFRRGLNQLVGADGCDPQLPGRVGPIYSVDQVPPRRCSKDHDGRKLLASLHGLDDRARNPGPVRHPASRVDGSDRNLHKSVCRRRGLKAQVPQPVLEIWIAEEFDFPVGNRTWVEQHRRGGHI